MVLPHIPPGTRLLDIGCGDGTFLRRAGSRLREGIGIDPDLAQTVEEGPCRLLAGTFPDELPTALGLFDVITMLAVFEHVPPAQQGRWAQHCASLLVPGGRLVLTIPSPAVDGILRVLKHLPFLYEGRSLEQHHGFETAATPKIFSALELVTAAKFQFGLNNCFVFRKSA